jgi:hypothetical protein
VKKRQLATDDIQIVGQLAAVLEKTSNRYSRKIRPKTQTKKVLTQKQITISPNEKSSKKV